MRYMMLWMGLGCLLVASPVFAQVAEPVEAVQHIPLRYQAAGTTAHGHLFLPADASEPVPGVVVYPEWWGVNDYAKRRGRMLAELGYAALVVDLYGEGKVTEDPQQAGQWAGALRNDPALRRQRALAGYEQLREHEAVRQDALAAIGYCFGGTTALHLAYANPDGLQGVVSFHGNLTPPREEDTIHASIFIAHGAADDFVPEEQVDAWQQAMEQRGVDYIFTAYAGAIHSFTNPDADAHGINGVSYDRKADRRSWAHMRHFFEALFAASASEAEAEARQPTTIHIAEAGTIRIAGQETTRKELAESVPRDAPVRIRMHANTKHSYMMEILKALGTAGVTDVRFTVE